MRCAALAPRWCCFGDSYSDAYTHAVGLEKAQGLTFVHPFDDPDVGVRVACITVPAVNDVLRWQWRHRSTGHAFYQDRRPTYQKEAAEDGFKRALAWFKAKGVA